jgi:hypothetical protein
VRQHLSLSQSVATGLRVLPETKDSFAATQAAWRFFANERVSLPALAEPMIEYAREVSDVKSSSYALVMHDFSDLNYMTHESKTDRIRLCNNLEYGYFLQSAVLVSDQAGEPLAPLYIGLEASDGVHSSRRERVLPRRRQLDELNRTFGYIEGLGLKKPCVHIVDRQADSLLHLRRFVRCGRRFVIRSNDIRRVEFEGESVLLKEVEEQIKKKLKYVRKVKYLGRKAFQYVAETEVVLSRMGRTKRPTKEQPNKRQNYKGKPIRLRYVFSEVRDKKGKVLASWRLWTNVENEVKGEEIALWYYWRWRIESFFKLLKRGGQHLEQWQQESVEAIAKRMMIVAQVCVIVWSLAASKDEKAGEIREFLVRLSGRLMKRGVDYTIPALLAGMWQFLTLIDVLEKYTTAELKEIAQEFLQILGSKTESKDV